MLYGNSDVQSIKQELENIVGGFLGSGNTYNSLSQVGLQLDSSFTSIQATSPKQQTSTSQPVQAQTLQGTDGQLQPLNVSALLGGLRRASRQRCSS